MKINSYSLTYSGSFREPMFAAATPDGCDLWAAASGPERDTADEVIQQLMNLANHSNSLTAQAIEACLETYAPSLRQYNAQVSLGGVYFDSGMMNMFNIGNVRILVFSRGYAKMHSEDHTEAYDLLHAQGEESRENYDELRYMVESQNLSRALGNSQNSKLRFYEPYAPQHDDAFLICTDCFWKYIGVVEMELDYRKAAGPEEWLKIMSRRVLMRGGRKLDNENFAAIAAMID